MLLCYGGVYCIGYNNLPVSRMINGYPGPKYISTSHILKKYHDLGRLASKPIIEVLSADLSLKFILNVFNSIY